MRDRIDPLIEDRAPWLFRPTLAATVARPALNRVLGYDRTVALAETFETLPCGEIMDIMAAKLARNVEVSGLGQMPRHGAALVVANHPTGIADGIILHSVLRTVRKDAYYFANHDILKVLPQMDEMIAPVEWRKDRRSHAKTRGTMVFARQAVKDGRLGVIFPSGRLAKRRGARLHERPWMASAAMLARKFDLPVIPLLRSLVASDAEKAIELGALELAAEDFGLLSTVCPARYDYASAWEVFAEEQRRSAAG